MTYELIQINIKFRDFASKTKFYIYLNLFISHTF